MSEMNVPKLRFREFEGEWVEKKLGDYGKLIKGLTYSPDNIRDKGLLVLRSSNIQNNQISFKDNVYVDLEVSDEVLTRENDILICVRNGSKRLIGKNIIIQRDLEKSTHGAFMSVFRGASNKFIAHWFKTQIYYKEVHKNLGATINSINGSDLKKFKIYLPQKPEQQKIANFLTSIDQKIEQLTKKEKLLLAYKKGIMQKIFSQEIRFQDENGEVYGDWVERKLGEVCSNISSGKTKSKDNGRFKVYGSTGIIGKTDTYTHSGEYILVARVGANAGLTNYVNDKFSVTDNTLIISSKNDILSPKFILFFLQNYKLNRLVFGSGQPLITGGQLKSLKLNLPSISEQTKIANFLSSIDKKIEQINRQIEESKGFKKGLLQQMFV